MIRISELIEELQKAKEKYGDSYFLLDSNTYGFDVEDGWFCPEGIKVKEKEVTKETQEDLCYEVPEGTYLYIDPT